jgi:hypothetical protein
MGQKNVLQGPTIQTKGLKTKLVRGEQALKK